MRNDGAIFEQIIKDRSLTLQTVSDNLNITRQTVMNYFKSKKFSYKTLYKILDYFKMTEYEFLNYAVLNSSTLDDKQTPYKSNTDFCLDQLQTVNAMLQKALENESKALTLIDYLIKKSPD